MPETKPEDFLKKAAINIITILHQKQGFMPKLCDGDEITTAYHTIAKLLNRSLEPPTQVPLVPPPRVHDDDTQNLPVQSKEQPLASPLPPRVQDISIKQLLPELKKQWEQNSFPSTVPAPRPSLFQRIYKNRPRNFKARATTNLAQCVQLLNHIYDHTG